MKSNVQLIFYVRLVANLIIFSKPINPNLHSTNLNEYQKLFNELKQER